MKKIILLALAVIGLTGCNQPSNESTPSQNPSANTPPPAIPATNTPPTTNAP